VRVEQGVDVVGGPPGALVVVIQVGQQLDQGVVVIAAEFGEPVVGQVDPAGLVVGAGQQLATGRLVALGAEGVERVVAGQDDQVAAGVADHDRPVLAVSADGLLELVDVAAARVARVAGEVAEGNVAGALVVDSHRSPPVVKSISTSVPPATRRGSSPVWS
jgi:hypothetical protein